MIQFYCVKCGRRIKVSDQARGTKTQCPQCRSMVGVPGEVAADPDMEAIRALATPEGGPLLMPNVRRPSALMMYVRWLSPSTLVWAGVVLILTILFAGVFVPRWVRSYHTYREEVEFNEHQREVANAIAQANVEARDYSYSTALAKLDATYRSLETSGYCNSDRFAPLFLQVDVARGAVTDAQADFAAKVKAGFVLRDGELIAPAVAKAEQERIAKAQREAKARAEAEDRAALEEMRRLVMASMAPTTAPAPNAAAAKTPPATASASTEPMQQARALYTSHQYEEALKVYDGILAKAPQNAEALEWSGLCLAYLGDAKKAEARLKQAMAVSKLNRMLTYNYAVLIHKANPVRAAMVLEAYLEGTAGTTDEFMFAALGTTIQHAVALQMSGTVLEDQKRFYFAYKERLEAVRPGKKLWGTQWIEADDYAAKTANFDAAQARFRSTLAAYEAARQSYVSSQRPALPATFSQTQVSVTTGWWPGGEWYTYTLPQPASTANGDYGQLTSYITSLQDAVRTMNMMQAPAVPEVLFLNDDDPPLALWARK